MRQTPRRLVTGRVSHNTRRLLREEGKFLYDSDAYNDDLPYRLAGSPPYLVIPYTLVTNDARYLFPNGLSSGDGSGEFLNGWHRLFFDPLSPALSRRERECSL